MILDWQGNYRFTAKNEKGRSARASSRKIYPHIEFITG
jgi:hypothetical protein